MLHDLPDAQDAGADLARCAPGAFVVQHQPRHAQALLPGARDEFVAGAEGMRPAEAGGGLGRGRGGPAFDHEAAADREVAAVGQHRAVASSASIRMPLGCSASDSWPTNAMSRPISNRSHGGPAGPAGRCGAWRRAGAGRGRIDRVRRLAQQAEDRAHVRRMAVPVAPSEP
jgi:hypothetical protein